MGVSMMQSKRRILLNEPHIVTPASAGIVNFSTDMIAPLKQCRVNFSPVQSGSGDPSPSNIRPIMGWNGVTVGIGEENLINPGEFIRVDGYTISYQGIPTPGDSSGYSENFYAVEPNALYVLTGSGLRVPVQYDQNHKFVTRPSGANPPIVFTTQSNINYLRLQYLIASFDVATIQLEKGNISKGKTLYPVDWTTPAGTVYGGYVDLVTGELVATHKLKHVVASDIGGVSTGTQAPYRPYTNIISDAKAHLTPQYFVENMLCDKLTAQSVGRWDPLLWEAYLNNTNRLVWGAPAELSTSTAVKNWIADIGGLDLIYELATPITYQLDPVTIKTLRGQNNIWSNTNGDIQIKYWKH